MSNSSMYYKRAHLAQNLLGPRRMLYLWYENLVDKLPPGKDFHLFKAPNAKGENSKLLYHAPSCRFFLLPPLDSRLFSLAMSGEAEAKPLIDELYRRYRVSELAAAFQRHAAIMTQLEAVSTPPPSTEEPHPSKGELLMFGNLLCNMDCPYCLSREARAEATEGKAPKLMELETAKQSVRFIAERMAGYAEHVYINFTLGGEPLLFQERYRELRNYCKEVSEETGTPITLNINTNGTAFTDEFFKYCEENDVCMAISIDGPKDIHDEMRPFRSGKVACHPH